MCNRDVCAGGGGGGGGGWLSIALAYVGAIEEQTCWFVCVTGAEC